MNSYEESRRKFIRHTGLSTIGYFLIPSWVKAKGVPFNPNYPLHNIPINKNLDDKWVKSLYKRGNPTSYFKSKNELKYIGMPAGGLHSGTVYLGGDGRLWLWEIFYIDIKKSSWKRAVL